METEKKPNRIIGKISLFLRTFLPCVICFVVMLALVIVGTTFSKEANQIKNARYQELVKIQNNIESMRLALKETVTIVDEPDYGFNSQRQQSDYQYFSSWITDAFNWSSLEEYTEHRNKYVNDLGAEHSFVRVDGMMPYLEEQPLVARDYGNPYNPNANMSCRMTAAPTQYVASIDEETGIYSYVAMVRVQSKDNVGHTRSSSTPIIMTYDILPDDGTTAFRILNFTAST